MANDPTHRNDFPIEAAKVWNISILAAAVDGRKRRV
jgi:hypothetical protein